MTGDAAADHVVDGTAERPHAVVVDLWQVEVHAARAVAVDLGAGDEGAGELTEHEGVEDVARRVQRRHPQTVIGVDVELDLACGDAVIVGEQVPPHVAVGLDRRVTPTAPPAHSIVPMSLTCPPPPGWNADRESATAPGLASTTVAAWTYRSGCSWHR